MKEGRWLVVFCLFVCLFVYPYQGCQRTKHGSKWEVCISRTGSFQHSWERESEWKSGVPAPCHILWPLATGIDRVAWWRVGHGGSAGASAHRHLLQYRSKRSGNLTVNSLARGGSLTRTPTTSPSVGGRKQQQTTQTLQPSLPTSHPTTCSQSP